MDRLCHAVGMRATVSEPTCSPAADEQMCRVYFFVKQLDEQMKRLVSAGISSPPHHLFIPDVVKHVQLREEKRNQTSVVTDHGAYSHFALALICVTYS